MQILKIMIAVFLIFAFLFLPVFIKIGLVFSKTAKKLYFGIYLFGVFTVLSGYAELKKDGIYVHLSPKKAYYFAYKKLLSVKNSIKPLKDFQIIEVKTCIDLGSEWDFFNVLLFGYLHNLTTQTLKNFFCDRKPYLVLDNKINLTNENKCNFYAEIKVLFNFLLVILEIFKFLSEKIINVFRQQKQQN